MNRPERAALQVLESHDLLSAPVKVREVAHALGAEIRQQPFDGDISGMLLRNGDKTLIGLNEGHSPSRQRFSIAHELGHLILHRGKPLFVDHTVRVNLRDSVSATGTEREEVEANQFAAQLLMPEPLVRLAVEGARAADERLTDAMLVDDLAKDFEVSPQAMSFRLINLGIIDPSGT